MYNILYKGKEGDTLENEIMYINLDDIIPNRFQPREVFDEDALNKLADSIRQHGVIEPILVRPVSNKYEIVAGERRYKASVIAGLTNIPAIVRKLDDKESSIVAFIENEHRSDVSAIEEARTMERILKNNNMTQEELAKELGVNQSTIANKIRLLNLPFEVQDALMHNKISERHARSLLSIKDEEKQIELLNRIIERKMTVRELDSEIKSMNENNNNINSFNNNPTIQNVANNDLFGNYLSNHETEIESTPVNNAPSDDGFMSFLNNYDNNNPLPAEEPAPAAPEVPGTDDDFMKFLNNYDINNPTPVEEANAPSTETPGDDGFMNYLNNYDNNNPLPAEEPVAPAPQTPNNNSDFMNFLNNYNNTTPEEPATTTNNGMDSYLNDNNDIPLPNEFSPDNIDMDLYNDYDDTQDDEIPSVTSNVNQYVEQNDKFVDVSKHEKITSVDEIIKKLGEVVSEIKEKSIYKIDTDEINFDDIYQITIKIDKRDF